MKKETVIIIIGIIALAILWYYVSKKPTVTPVNTGIIPQATSAVNKLGTSIAITATDIKAVVDVLGGLLGQKSSSNTGIAGGTDTSVYPTDIIDSSNIFTV